MKKLLAMTALATAMASPIAFAQTTTTTETQRMTNPADKTAPASKSTTETTVHSNGAMHKDTKTTTTSPNADVAAMQADQKKWWHDRDFNNDGKISREEYVANETKDGKTTAAEANKDFDESDDDKDGFLNASETKAWFERMGDKVAGDKK